MSSADPKPTNIRRSPNIKDFKQLHNEIDDKKADGSTKEGEDLRSSSSEDREDDCQFEMETQ